MKGLQMLNGWCLLIVAGLLVMQQIHLTVAYTMEETCKYINGGWIADPNDCQSYGYCKNSVLQGKAKCPDGAYYDRDLGVCNYKKACHYNLGTMCQGVANLTLFAHPDNCTEFVYCENGLTYVGACPKYQTFNANKNECDFSGGSQCAALSICRLVKDNVFAADPKICGKFIVCQKGTGESKECPGGLFFNPGSNKCQSTKVCVNDNNGNTNSNDQPPPKPDKSLCTAANTFIADDATCYGYFKCTGAEEVGDWYKCPPKTHFDPVNKICVTPYTFKCTKDRCGNMGAQFMAAATLDDCKNYLNCKNDEYIYKSSDTTFKGTPCNKGYYFNEFLQQCVPTSPSSNPEYKLCPPPAPKIIG